MASLEDRFVKERQHEADSDEEAAEQLFMRDDAETAERLRPVQDGGCMVNLNQQRMSSLRTHFFHGHSGFCLRV